MTVYRDTIHSLACHAVTQLKQKYQKNQLRILKSKIAANSTYNRFKNVKFIFASSILSYHEIGRFQTYDLVFKKNYGIFVFASQRAPERLIGSEKGPLSAEESFEVE